MRTKLLLCLHPDCNAMVPTHPQTKSIYCNDCRIKVKKERQKKRHAERKNKRYYGMRVFDCPVDKEGLPLFPIGAIFTTYDFMQTLKLGYWPEYMGVVYNRKRYRVIGGELVDRDGNKFKFDNKRLVSK